MIIVVQGLVLPIGREPLTANKWLPGDQAFLERVFREVDTKGDDGSASK